MELGFPIVGKRAEAERGSTAAGTETMLQPPKSSHLTVGRMDSWGRTIGRESSRTVEHQLLWARGSRGRHVEHGMNRALTEECCRSAGALGEEVRDVISEVLGKSLFPLGDESNPPLVSLFLWFNYWGVELSLVEDSSLFYPPTNVPPCGVSLIIWNVAPEVSLVKKSWMLDYHMKRVMWTLLFYLFMLRGWAAIRLIG